MMSVKKVNSPFQLAVVIITTLLLIFSCRSKEEPEPNGEPMVISTKIASVVYEETKDIGDLKSRNQNYSKPLQRRTIALNDEYDLIAEMSTIKTGANAHQPFDALSKGGAPTTGLNDRIKYKVVVYDADGHYLKEQDFIHGLEASAEALLLDGNKNYSFIAYTVNSTSVLPSVLFQSPESPTLANSQLQFDGALDFMYFRKDMKVSGHGPNHLGIIFKHKLSEITTIIDATQTGYTVKHVESYFTAHHPDAIISLADGAVARAGTFGNQAVTFSTLNSLVVTSQPTIMNADPSRASSYHIQNISIGEMQSNSVPPFNNIEIKPGVKYNLHINIVRKDAIIEYGGNACVRINGQIWMRHNLGANTTSDPEADPYKMEHQGHYYMWGLKDSLVKGTDMYANKKFYPNNLMPAADTWNTNNGTTLAPIKTQQDPCPAGFRIPTSIDMQVLLANTKLGNNIGTWNEGPFDYTPAKVLVSNVNSEVKVVFPVQGWYPPTQAATSFTELRGVYAYTWLSDFVNGQVAYLSLNQTEKKVNTLAFSDPKAPMAFPIRCIAE